MKFIHEGTKHEIDPDRLTFAEARAFEKASGHTVSSLLNEGAQDVASIQALLWIVLKRAEPALRYSDLDDMALGDFEFLSDEDEASKVDGGDADTTEDGVDPTSPGDGTVEDSTPTG